MDVGFETIGNATLICRDNEPVLVTDPWITGSAYFGSWGLAYEIPDAQMEAIRQSEYIWISHGHPDHLSMRSLKNLSDKKILLADHVGGRIARELGESGLNVTVLKDRVWTRLSPRIHVLTIADYFQDSILLVDVDGTLIVNLNDASDRSWGRFVRKTISGYRQSFLLKLFGYGDADMINLFDEEGARIEPEAGLKRPVGPTVAEVAEAYGVTHVVPFSSMHRYQRTDSVWANEYTTPPEAHNVGFESSRSELLPAFISYDVTRRRFDSINPARSTEAPLDPKMFKDDWSQRAESHDMRVLKDYFRTISHLPSALDFINVRVGGEDNVIELRERKFQKGIIFEVPKTSLMRAVKLEVFDDLLIGNFMKTTFVGKWDQPSLYPDFTPYVAKYADNGGAKSANELAKYFQAYRKRAVGDYLRHSIRSRVGQAIRARLGSKNRVYQLARTTYNRFIGPQMP